MKKFPLLWTGAALAFIYWWSQQKNASGSSESPNDAISREPLPVASVASVNQTIDATNMALKSIGISTQIPALSTPQVTSAKPTIASAGVGRAYSPATIAHVMASGNVYYSTV